MKPSGWRGIGAVMALLALSACEFGVAPEEGGTTPAPASQTASLEAGVGAQSGEGVAFGGTHGGPAAPQGDPEPAGTPVPASPVPCVPAMSGGVSWSCMPARQTGDRSHGDPQPWQPTPVPQPY